MPPQLPKRVGIRALSSPVSIGIAVFAIVVAAAFLRQTGIEKWRTVWAEDGYVFAQCDYDRPFLDCLAQPYEGYLHIVPRVGAAAVTAFGSGGLPFGMALVSALVAGACGVLVARAVAEATRSLASGMLAGISLALVWGAGTEVSGNLTNLHWIVLAASIMVLTCGWLGRRVGAADLLLLALTALSSPFAVLLLGFGLGGVVARAQSARRALGVVAVALVPQLVVIATSHRDPPLQSVDLEYVLLVWRGVGGEAWFGPRPWNLLVPALLIVTIVALLELAHIRLRRGLGLVVDSRLLAGAICATVALPAVGLALLAVSVRTNGGYADRYAYEAAVLTACAVAIGCGVASAAARAAIDEAAVSGASSFRWAHRAAVWAPSLVVITMGFGFVLSFRLVAAASSGPDVVDEIATARPVCMSGAPAAIVTISPRATSPTGRVWSVAIPCERFGR